MNRNKQLKQFFCLKYIICFIGAMSLGTFFCGYVTAEETKKAEIKKEDVKKLPGNLAKQNPNPRSLPAAPAMPPEVQELGKKIQQLTKEKNDLIQQKAPQEKIQSKMKELEETRVRIGEVFRTTLNRQMSGQNMGQSGMFPGGQGNMAMASTDKELKALIEKRKQMVEKGAKSEEIKAITEQITNRTRALSPMPQYPSGMNPGGQQTMVPPGLGQAFFAAKTKMDGLIQKRKELIEKKAPSQEIQALTQQIEDQRRQMYQSIQVTMQAQSNKLPALPQLPGNQSSAASAVGRFPAGMAPAAGTQTTGIPPGVIPQGVAPPSAGRTQAVGIPPGVIPQPAGASSTSGSEGRKS